MRAFKAFLGILVYLFTVAIVIAVLISAWGYSEFQKDGPLLVESEFSVPSGSSLKSISFKLAESKYNSILL